jgi:tetratricopeptide (TPR) repeat protein
MFFILLSILIFVCTPAVARASSDILIVVNGLQVFSDVPPQLINGRTMVPIRAVSEALGAEVTWNNSTRSVEITKNNEVVINEVNNNKTSDLTMLKLYIKLANHYYNLGQINDRIIDLFIELETKKSTRETYKIFNKLDDVIDSCKSIRKVNQQLIDEANEAGINLTDTNEILLRYDNAIAHFEKAKNVFFHNEDKYASYIHMGLDESMVGAHKAREGYNTFNNLIQDY